MTIQQLASAQAALKLEANPNAVLIDVRTQPEWMFVGQPDMAQAHFISWLPKSAEGIAGFVGAVQQEIPETDREIYLMCRSGARSMAAAEALTAAGYSNLTNVSDGFEGDQDSAGHRRSTNGWIAANLPWQQS